MASGYVRSEAGTLAMAEALGWLLETAEIDAIRRGEGNATVVTRLRALLAVYSFLSPASSTANTATSAGAPKGLTVPTAASNTLYTPATNAEGAQGRPPPSQAEIAPQQSKEEALPKPLFAVGDEVEANWKGRGDW